MLDSQQSNAKTTPKRSKKSSNRLNVPRTSYGSAKKDAKKSDYTYHHLVMDKVEKSLSFLDHDFQHEGSERFVLVEKVPDSTIKALFGKRISEEPDADNDDDSHTHCDQCKSFYDKYCYKHPFYFVPDRKPQPGDEVNENGEQITQSEYTLPPFFEIKESDIPGAGKGVYTTMDLPVGTCFGPYKGEKKNEPNKEGYMWVVRTKTGQFYRDGVDRKKANWMRYINSARIEKEQNLIAFQFCQRIFYRVFKPIPAGRELLVCKPKGEEGATLGA